MSEFYERQILQILVDAAKAAVSASIKPALPIAHLGITFPVPSDQKYLEIVHIPNNRAGDFLGEEKNYQGIFRLILHWPNDGLGVYPAMDLVASIMGYFSKGMYLQNVQIYEKPNLTGMLIEGQEMLLPCSIRYQCFRP